MPGGKGNIKPSDNTNGFQMNPQNINREGRPRKIYTIIKETGFAPEDAIAVFSEFAYYTVKDLEKVEKDETKPALLRIVAGAISEAYKQKNFPKIKEILEYVIGKPNQPIQLSGNFTDTKHVVEFKDYTKSIDK